MTDLLAVELEAGFVSDADGRLLHARTPDRRAAPHLVVGTDGSRLVWALRSDVDDETADQVSALLRAERPGPVDLGWTPAAADWLLPLTGTTTSRVGPSYVLAAVAPTTQDVDVHTDADADAEEVRRRVPEADRDLAAPWAVALVDGAVAAVCETARATDAAVSAGVWTYEPHRRRGLATAVTERWAVAHGDRTVLYATTIDNVASQAVARRLGATAHAHWWWAG